MLRRIILACAAAAVVAIATPAAAWLPKSYGVAAGWPKGPGRIPATLPDLTLTTSSATAGQAFSATVQGNSVGSTLTLSAAAGGKYSLTGTTLSGSGLTAGTDNPSIDEVLAGSLNGPHRTVFTITVSAAALGGQLDFSNANNSGLAPVAIF